MKAKIDVTIFKNGDMDILQASIYEELWKDYCTFKQRAVMQQEKETKKGIFLSRRYYRAALLSLFTFFEGVINNWIKTIIQDRPEFSSTAEQQTLKKCDAVIEYCFFCSYTKHTGTLPRFTATSTAMNSTIWPSLNTSTDRPFRPSKRRWKNTSVTSKP